MVTTNCHVLIKFSLNAEITHTKHKIICKQYGLVFKTFASNLHTTNLFKIECGITRFTFNSPVTNNRTYLLKIQTIDPNRRNKYVKAFIGK